MDDAQNLLIVVQPKVADLGVDMALTVKRDEEDIALAVMGGAGRGSGFNSEGCLCARNSLRTAARIVGSR